MATEKELDRALASALRDSQDFRAWFFTQLPGASGYDKVVLCRADHPWGKVRAILPNASTGALEAVVRESETDVLLVLESPAGKRLGVHIENKLGSGAFTPYQPELYAARADQWVGREAYGNYHSWLTVLIAPRRFIEENEARARLFNARLSHEEVEVHLPAFGRRGDA